MRKPNLFIEHMERKSSINSEIETRTTIYVCQCETHCPGKIERWFANNWLNVLAIFLTILLA